MRSAVDQARWLACLWHVLTLLRLLLLLCAVPLLHQLLLRLRLCALRLAPGVAHQLLAHC
jgi:hypothetical protein